MVFNSSDIIKEIESLRLELRIKPAYINNKLIHLRVGDFFPNYKEAKLHVLERLDNIPNGSHIITNDENLLLESDFIKILKHKEAKLISTNGLSAEDILRLMTQYLFIDGNDSTLALWAAILSGGIVSCKKNNLIDFIKFIQQQK